MKKIKRKGRVTYKMDCELKGSIIYIYGKGGTGMRTADLLIKAGLTVGGFIDKQAQNMKGDLPTFTLPDAVKHISDKHSVVIFICVKNVFLHDEIARELVDKGFNYLIYKPLSVLNGRNDDDLALSINKIYESVVEGVLPPDNACIIPYTKNIPLRLNDKFLIKDCGDTFLTWTPIELIFNYEEGYDYPGCNMPLMFGLVNLYNAFLGKLSPNDYDDAIQDFYLYCGEWLHNNGLSSKEKPFEGFLESRAGVFQNLNKLAEINQNFFEQNAPTATYTNGKFYLSSSGRNRVAFQIAKGYKYAPLRIAKKDYLTWVNLSMVRSVEENLSDEKEISRFAPAAHPYLADLPCEFSDYMSLFILPAAKEIVRNLYLQCVVTDAHGIRHIDFEKFERLKHTISIYEDMNDDGVCRSYFKSLGFNVIDELQCDDKVIFFLKDNSSPPKGCGYILFTDRLPNLYRGNLMFVARGMKHSYYGVKL